MDRELRRRGKRLAAFLLAAFACSCSATARSPWQAVQLPTDASFDGIWFTDSLNGWISGGAREVPGGLLGRTRDGGRTWTIRSDVIAGMGDRAYLHQIQFRDSLRGGMVGDGGRVLLTDDGGATWRAAHSMGYGTLTRLQLLGEHDGWALGPAATIGTRDGGESWHELVRNRSETGYLSGRAAAFTDALHGWLLSHTEQLMRTDNGGLDWEPVPLPIARDSVGALWDITFVDPMNGWLVGEFGTICRTRDGGVTWERQRNGVPVERVLAKGEKPRPRGPILDLEEPSRLQLAAVRFADTERGFAVGHYADAGESVVLGTHDGGATWATELTAPGQFLHALFVLDRRHAWVTGSRVRQLPQAIYRYTSGE